jgi:hypothetical protein
MLILSVFVDALVFLRSARRAERNELALGPVSRIDKTAVGLRYAGEYEHDGDIRV